MITRPRLAAPPADATKFNRGMVLVLAGAMPGAARLAARAAMRGGAGYVMLAAPGGWQAGLPDALVQADVMDAGALLGNPRIGAVVIGPGLGRDAAAEVLLAAALASERPLVIDGDALTLMGGDAARQVRGRGAPVVLTPHGGEFARMFDAAGDKREVTQAAAQAGGSTIVHKGAVTVVADAARVAESRDGPSWLASAGTGDVLAGLVAARLAAGGDPFVAAGEAVWLHARAGQLAGPALIADDLIDRLAEAMTECLTA